MNLYSIGNTVLNMDRIIGIQDHVAASGTDPAAGRSVLRVLFEGAQIDLMGREAQTFRRWFRHTARNLDPHKDEYGEELISPEEQLRRGFESLLAKIERMRPRDADVRHAAHRMGRIIDHYLTGELQPVRAKDFASSFEVGHDAVHSAPAAASVAPPARGGAAADPPHESQ
jgi:hypothetical protein